MSAVIVGVKLKLSRAFDFFLLGFGRDKATTFATVNEASERKFANLRPGVRSFTQKLLNVVKLVERHHGFMATRVPFFTVRDLTQVKTIIENTIDRTLPQWLAAQSAHFTGQEAPFGVGNGHNLRGGVSTGDHQLPHFAHQGEAFRVFDDDPTPFGIFSVQITKWGHIRHPALVDASLHASLGVFGEVEDELVSDATFYAEQQSIITRQILLVDGLNRLDEILLQHPLNLPAINRITSKTIDLPTEYSLRFTGLDPRKHFCKHWSIAGLLGRLSLLIYVNDVELELCGKFVESDILVFD